jgi:two-component system, LytTR family, sensor kinase
LSQHTGVSVLRLWLVAFGCFTSLALLFTSQVWIDYAYAGRPLSWRRAFLVALVDWELWTIATPLVAWLSTRFPFSPARWGVPLAIHLPAGIALSGVKLFLEAMLTPLILGYGRPGPFSFLKIHLTLLTYWGIVAAIHVVRYYRVARARELRAAQLEMELARAQVEALKMQLHPHFLFNTLNTIAGLMRDDPDAAELMLAKLAELLRRTFETADVQELPLDRELEFIEAYLTIQRLRYGERLRVSIDVSDAVRRALVPSLILQPLVENAIRHGVAEKPGPGRVEIGARLEDTDVVITIANDGPTLPVTVRERYGLRNIRSRLLACYGARGSLAFGPQLNGGAVATLRFPFSTAGAAL